MKALLTLSLLAGLSAQALADSPASRLDEVLQRGEMSVCTTGDYKPYSYLRPDGSYEGIDISMAQSLAKSLGCR